jgi:hypothetical protein
MTILVDFLSFLSFLDRTDCREACARGYVLHHLVGEERKLRARCRKGKEVAEAVSVRRCSLKLLY